MLILLHTTYCGINSFSLKFVLLNFETISLIVWKLCAFRQRSNCGNFQSFCHHNFWLKWKFKFWCFIGKIWLFRSIRIYLISKSKNIFLSIKIRLQVKNQFFFCSFFSKYFQSSVILYIPMITSEKSHQNLSDYNQFLLKKRFEVE